MSSNRSTPQEANQKVVISLTLVFVSLYFYCIPTIIGLICLKLFKNKYLKINEKSIAFMHPNCSAQGGGEKVLWSMVKAILKNQKSPQKIIIYIRADDPKTEQQIHNSTKTCFGLNLENSNVQFVKLLCTKYADPHKYKFLTIIMEALGSNLATIEAIFRFTPEVYLDSTGYGFSLFIPKLLSLGEIKTIAYVHYPIMQRDMIKNIKNQSYNNKSIISNNEILRTLKMVYYKILFFIYHRILETCDFVYANSTWTFNHLTKYYNLVCKKPNILRKFQILYPPCDVSLSKSRNCLKFDERTNDFLSIGQFRPEKNQKLLITSFAKAIEKDSKVSKHKLIMIGGCRNSEDNDRLEELINLAKTLKISDNVMFNPNLPFEEKNNFLKLSKFGVHAMIDEHFGIVLVEFQAAGAICCAHDSAGPKFDIIGDGTNRNENHGFLWKNEEDLIDFYVSAVNMDGGEYNQMQGSCRIACQRFSDENFMEKFQESLEKIL